jgi:clan AA aspartic protease (TIGR02281 family)
MIERMSWATIAAVLLLPVVLAVAATPAGAQMYRWTDDQGNPHYSQGLDSVPDRYRATARQLLYRNAPAAAAPADRTPAGSASTIVSFTPGGRIYVDARINDSASVHLLLDTGADRTVITPRALVAAGVSIRAAGVPGTIRGATGTADVAAYPIDSLQVGQARVGKMLIISHDINEADTDGLLGRDFLDQFKVTIDNTAGQVTLGPK